MAVHAIANNEWMNELINWSIIMKGEYIRTEMMAI